MSARTNADVIDIENGTSERPTANCDAPWLVRSSIVRPLMLDIRFRNGNRFGVAYPYLNNVEYDPSTGISVWFTMSAVIISGRRLGPLYEGFLQQRVEWVAESPRFPARGMPAVTSIEVKQR